MNPELPSFIYKNLLKPILFSINPDSVHDGFTQIAKVLGKYEIFQELTDLTFNYKNPLLEKEVSGIKFRNPIGLSAGYDYNGHFLKILPHIGFGFSTVGTVTNLPYTGNTKPMFARLPKSQSLLVNKGFKSDGADIISKRLNDPKLKDITFGVSVGSSNLTEINSVNKAIDDYVACIIKMESAPYTKFYELNISCPNISLADSFTAKENFAGLLKEIKTLNIKQPIFIKMPNELSSDMSDELVKTALNLGVNGFIFSNLVKNSTNSVFDKKEIKDVAGLKGNFSGKPTQSGSNMHIKYFREKYGKDIIIFGTGGVFNAQDAKEKLDLGADLVQLITGIVFEGPQLIGRINRGLAKNLEIK